MGSSPIQTCLIPVARRVPRTSQLTKADVSHYPCLTAGGTAKLKSMSSDPAWPAPTSLLRMLYWGDTHGGRPQDHVRRDIPDVSRRALVVVLQHGKDAHPDMHTMGWASCRICGVNLGSGDLTAFGYVWPEKADHYILAHAV